MSIHELVPVSTCGRTAQTAAKLTTCFSGTPAVSLLGDELALPEGGTAASGYDPAPRLVTLRLRSVNVQNGRPSYLPASGPYTLKVYARNVP